MKLENIDEYVTALGKLGFEVKYMRGIPDAYFNEMSIEIEKDYYDEPILNIKLTGIENDAYLARYKKAFEVATNFINENSKDSKQKIKYLFDKNKVHLGNILETDEDTFVVGSVASNSPEFHELTLTSVRTGETVAMGQSLSMLVDSFCYYFERNNKDIPEINIYHSFKDYLDEY